MNFLERHSFKHIIVLISFLTLIMLSTACITSMSYLFSSSITKYTDELWQDQTNNIADQARFSILRNSEEDIKNILNFLKDPLIIHTSVYSGNKVLYSSGEPPIPSCNQNNSVFYFFENKKYRCFNADIKSYNNNKIGSVTIIFSTKKTIELINKNMIIIVTIVSIISAFIFTVFYYFSTRLTSPLTKLSLVMKEMTSDSLVSSKKTVEEEGTLDIRNIQKTFNQMILKIDQHKSILEEQVRSRTLELTDAYKEAQAASKVKTDILNIVVHEMRTPLHNAKYFFDLMINDNDKSYIPKVIKSFYRLETQINNLANFSKSTTGNGVKLYKTSFSPDKLITSLANELTPLLRQNNNKLSAHCYVKTYINSDKQLIMQIITNLVSNANKFTRNGLIELICKEDDINFTIEVCDTGCGISDHDLKRIFTPFWQVDMSSTRNQEGSGLGLSICQLFSETLSGHISVSSKLNEGSVFTLSIPLIR